MQTDKAYGKDLVSKILATARGTEPVFLTTAWLTTKGIQAKLDGEHHVKATEREIRDILADLAKERRVTTSRGKGTYEYRWLTDLDRQESEATFRAETIGEKLSQAFAGKVTSLDGEASIVIDLSCFEAIVSDSPAGFQMRQEMRQAFQGV